MYSKSCRSVQRFETDADLYRFETDAERECSPRKFGIRSMIDKLESCFWAELKKTSNDNKDYVVPVPLSLSDTEIESG